MHPSQELLGLIDNRLSGKRIVLGITGSIAAVESVKLIHQLIRHGASVYPVMTNAATEIINPEAIFYAAGNRPIVKITGAVEHVEFCGQIRDRADLLLIAPCTANTISKIAHGIDDTTVTTFATTAIGEKIPILIVPAMHGSMYEHPILTENIKKLSDGKLNIDFIKPIKSENKYKLPSIDQITQIVIRKLWKNDLKDKKVLIISGATAEKVDDIRILTNLSTGQTGVALAHEAFMRGAQVTYWYGQSTNQVGNNIRTFRFQSVADLTMMVGTLDGSGKNFFDIIIVCAAISDYSCSKTISGKIKSGNKNLKIDLKPTPKIIPLIKKQTQKSIIVGFKAESKISEKMLIDRAMARLNEWKIDMVIANDLEKVKEKSNEIIIIDRKGNNVKYAGTKVELATRIFDAIIKQQ